MFTCRSCRGKRLRQMMLLGELPPARPLRLVFCTQCALIQITETASREKLSRKISHFPSPPDTADDTARQLAHRMIERCYLTPKSLVVELVEKNSSLLKHYQEKGIPTLALQFSANASQAMRADGVLADVIHASHIIARRADLGGFVEGIAAMLKPDGAAVIETRDVKALMDHMEMDVIGPERFFYFSATALRNLFAFHRLEMVDLERTSARGGSLKAYFQPADGPRSLQAWGGGQNVRALLEEEARWGVGDFSFYENFSQRAAELKSDLLGLLDQIKAQDQTIAIYGAPGKSTALLNFFDIGHKTFDFSVSRNVDTLTHSPLPILGPESLLEAQPDYVLLLDWRAAEQILAWNADYRRRGGKFIIPLPGVRVL